MTTICVNMTLKRKKLNASRRKKTKMKYESKDRFLYD